jgi:DNA-binding LacI/PurR family transcriptional regulator
MFDIKIDKNSSEPFYRQIENQIRRAIIQGTLSPGDQLPTEAELTEKLGVSVCTIREGFSSLVHDGLLIRRPRRGTFVAPHGRRVNTRDIGVVLLDLYSTITYGRSRGMQSISKIASEKGYNVHIFSVSGRAVELEDPTSQLNQLILNQQIAGLLVVSYIGERALSIFQAADIPFVALDVDYPRIDEYKVLPDDVDKLKMSFQYLYDLGKRRIGILSGKRADLGSGGRRRGDKLIETYLQFMEEKNLVVDSQLVKVGQVEVIGTMEEARLLTSELFSLEDMPDSVVCQGDSMLQATMDQIEARGLKIPHDIAVVGHGVSSQISQKYDSVLLVEFAEDVANVSIELLIQIIEGNPPEEKEIILPMPVHWPE